MASGGTDIDPDETGTFDPNEGADDKTPLILHHRDEMEMTNKTSTPFSSTSKHRTQETSFMGETPSGVIRDREVFQDIAADAIKEHFPNTDTSKYFAKMENGIVYVKIKGGTKNIWHKIRSKDGDVLIDRNKKLPKTLRNALGQTAEEIMTERVTENIRAEERIRELRETRENAFPEDYERIDAEIERLQEGVNERNRENEAIEEKLPLKQRIKAIFKKYGFTAFAVATAIGTVIGVIVANLKAGLTKVAKGVGNGLKELGKKLGEILPGMIGAIASFIFRTTGEVIGFLAKNAWLLIVGLVVLAVEQFKNKNK